MDLKLTTHRRRCARSGRRPARSKVSGVAADLAAMADQAKGQRIDGLRRRRTGRVARSQTCRRRQHRAPTDHPCIRTIKRPPSGNCAASNPRGGNDQPANKAQVRPQKDGVSWAFCRQRGGPTREALSRNCQTFLVRRNCPGLHRVVLPRGGGGGAKKMAARCFAPPSLGRKRPRMQRAEAPLRDRSCDA